MSHDELFKVRHSSLPPIGDGQGAEGIINRVGAQIVVDFFTHLALAGLTYQIQLGTEDAGVTSTAFITGIDDEAVWSLIDNNAGYAMIPLLYEINPGVLGAATLTMAMLEIDKSQKRYVSGGTAYVPANLNSQSAAGSFAGAAYVGGGSDIVAAAKSAVPASVELARKSYVEDALANTIGYPGTWDPCVYSVARRPMAVVYGAGSLIGHLGSGAATTASYGVIQVAQLTAAQVTL
jgi:hypothetical protein